MRKFLQWVFREEWERERDDRQKKWEETIEHYDKLKGEAIEARNNYYSLCESLKTHINNYRIAEMAIRAGRRGGRIS